MDCFDTLHCEKCLEPYSSKQNSFFISNCKHLQCSNCLAQGVTKPQVCAICNKKASLVTIGPTMPAQVKPYVLDIGGELKKLLLYWEFQRSHGRHLQSALIAKTQQLREERNHHKQEVLNLQNSLKRCQTQMNSGAGEPSKFQLAQPPKVMKLVHEPQRARMPPRAPDQTPITAFMSGSRAKSNTATVPPYASGSKQSSNGQTPGSMTVAPFPSKRPTPGSNNKTPFSIASLKSVMAPIATSTPNNKPSRLTMTIENTRWPQNLPRFNAGRL